MKRFIILCTSLLLVSITSAVSLAWDITNDPTTVTVGDVTLQDVAKIAILEYAGTVAAVNNENYKSFANIYESSASYAMDDFTGEGNVFAANGETRYTGNFSADKTYFILVFDSEGKYIASNALTLGTSNGFIDDDTGIGLPAGTLWNPDSGLTGSVDSWASSGNSVPEPTTTALIALGIVLFGLRRPQVRT